jgi:hypothetical protein
MKEKSDIPNILDYNKYKYLINNLNIGKSQNTIYREILLSRKYVTVVFNNETSSSIQINANTSLGKITNLAQKYPQELVFFEVSKEESLSLSKSHGTRNLNNKKLNSSEEFETNTKSNFDNSEKKNIFDSIKLSSLERFFYYYMKLLYIFYIFCSIILLLYTIVLIINSKFQLKSYFIWVTFALIMGMIYVGYIGFKKLNGTEIQINEEEKFDNDDLFWFNFFILVLTISSFIFLIMEHRLELKQKKYVGIEVICFYIIILLVEIFGLLYFDMTDRIVQLKVNDGYKLLEFNEEEKEKLIEV